jgi:uncharacterized phage-associated protein
VADVHDVAAALIERAGPMTAMKLEKLAYYAQAVSLADTGRALFANPIEAWKDGPVVPALYQRHRRQYHVPDWDGDPGALSADELASIDRTLELYGGRDADWLSNQTHIDEPWRKARGDRLPSESSKERITVESMRSYYRSLLHDPLVDAALEDPPDPSEFIGPDELRSRYADFLQ